MSDVPEFSIFEEPAGDPGIEVDAVDDSGESADFDDEEAGGDIDDECWEVFVADEDERDPLPYESDYWGEPEEEW